MITKSAHLLYFALLNSCFLYSVYIPSTTTSHVQAPERGLQVRPNRAVTEWPNSIKRFALVIGVDEYEDTQINRLEGAANDAKAIANVLIQYARFPKDQVIVLASGEPLERRPTRGNILRRLSNLRAAVPKDGLLLVTFAGHGIEREGKAYLLPSDAQVNGDIGLLEDTAINVEAIRERIRQTGVEQVVIILDACRNNPTGRGDSDNVMTEAYKRGFNFDLTNEGIKAFATLYAAEVGHRAYENKEKRQGYFTGAMVEGLTGAAANDKGEVTLGGLKKYIEEEVAKRSLLDLGKERQQRPFAVIEGYRADQLVIAVTPSKASADPPKTDLSFESLEAKAQGMFRILNFDSASDQIEWTRIEELIRRNIHPDPRRAVGAGELTIETAEKAAKEGKTQKAENWFRLSTICDAKSASKVGLRYLKSAKQMITNGETEEAETKLRYAIILNPQDVVAYLDVINLWQQLQKWEQAEIGYRQLIKIEPNSATWRAYLGRVLATQQKLIDAEGVYRQAVQLDPENARFHIDLCYVLQQQGKWPEAEAECKEGVRLDPSNSSYRDHLKRVLDKRKN